MNSFSNNIRRQPWTTSYNIAVLALLLILVIIGGVLLARPASQAPMSAPAASEVPVPTQFQRPSTMTFVPATNSCVVGGTVTSTVWHDNTGKAVELTDKTINTLKDADVEYTSFTFKSDEGRVFDVSEGGALYTSPGESLGLQLACDPQTMNTADSFGMVAIIWGGK